MSIDVLDQAAKEAGGRIIGALAARFRSLDIAEDAFSDACVKALEAWPKHGLPFDPAGWLYRTAERKALDGFRRQRTRERLPPAPPDPDRELSPEATMLADTKLIPDERLRLIFICCHPAVAPESRVALTLRLVCGLSVNDIAHAFLVPESTLAQRLVRAKRKISEAGIPFEVPGPEAWPDRLEAVLSTMEIAYSKSYEDSALAGTHAAYASEVLELTRALVEMLPSEAEALALAALVRYCEARRPARLNHEGCMVPLAQQNPALWLRSLIEEADTFLKRALSLSLPGPRVIQAAIHGEWCWRKGLQDPPPWTRILNLYHALLLERDDVVVRLNRAVALAEVVGPDAALAEVAALNPKGLEKFLPYQVLRADLCAEQAKQLQRRPPMTRHLPLRLDRRNGGGSSGENRNFIKAKGEPFLLPCLGSWLCSWEAETKPCLASALYSDPDVDRGDSVAGREGCTRSQSFGLEPPRAYAWRLWFRTAGAVGIECGVRFQPGCS